MTSHGLATPHPHQRVARQGPNRRRHVERRLESPRYCEECGNEEVKGGRNCALEQDQPV